MMQPISSASGGLLEHVDHLADLPCGPALVHHVSRLARSDPLHRCTGLHRHEQLRTLFQPAPVLCAVDHVFFWLTLRGAGPIDRRALWLTAFSFLGLFLTWEASALIAPGMVFAALVQRRGHLRPVLCSPAVWAAMVLVVLVIVIQASHVILQQTQFLWYGISLSDVKLIPMWRYPIPGVFQPWYYIWQSSWTQDALLPLLACWGPWRWQSGTLATTRPFLADHSPRQLSAHGFSAAQHAMALHPSSGPLADSAGLRGAGGRRALARARGVNTVLQCQ